MDNFSAAPKKATLALGKSLLHRGIKDDPAAIEAMFRQFIPPGERILNASYLGRLGTSYLPAAAGADIGWLVIFLVGLVLTLLVGVFQRSHCFGLVTERRVATIQTGLFGEVHYQDALLEYVNASYVQQPSIFGLYTVYTSVVLCVIVQLLLLLFFPDSWYSQLFYGPAKVIWSVFVLLGGLFFALYFKFVFFVFVKSGLVLGTKKGLPVPMFTDRKRLVVANRLHRTLSEMREARRPLASA